MNKHIMSVIKDISVNFTGGHHCTIIRTDENNYRFTWDDEENAGKQDNDNPEQILTWLVTELRLMEITK